jgi:hypothetical protein
MSPSAGRDEERVGGAGHPRGVGDDVAAIKGSRVRRIIGSDEHRGAKRVTVIASVLAVLASYGVGVGPLTANAASLTGSNFEIDGPIAAPDANLVVDGPGAGAIDWLSGGAGSGMRPGVVVVPDKPTGQNDDSFTQGTDINQPNATSPATITTGSIPNNKSDLTNFGIYKELDGTEPFVNVFWTRVQAPNGTTTMDFEFNQSSARSNDISPPGNPLVNTHTIPVRTPGDILITYFLAQGGTHPTLSKRLWTSGNVWGPSTQFSSADGLAAINLETIDAAHSDGVGPLDPFTFGEASIRLSAFASGVGTCETFGSVYLRSRSSATDTDENKDFIAPTPVQISNCDRVLIHKTEDGGKPLQGAVFTLYHNAAPLAAPRGNEDTATTFTCTSDVNGDCTILNVPKGDYWAVETHTPDGHDTAPDQAFSVTTGGLDVPLTFNDPIQHGTLVIIKDAVPNDAQDFTFTRDGSSFSLDDDADPTLSNTSSTQVVVGSHAVVETNIPDGWVNNALSCVDPSGGTTVDLATHTVHADVASNETVTCTYTDTFTKRDVNLQTTAAVAQANTSWNDGASLTGDGTHPVTGTVDFFVCGPNASATACNSDVTQVGGDATVSGSGSAFTATTTAPFTPTFAGNYCFRAEFHSTSAFYVDSTHTNNDTECFLKRNANLTVSKTAVAAFGRAYQWTIAKAVDKTHVDLPAGGGTDFHYTVTVGNTHSDDAWTVKGKITVTNPNNVAFTGVNVTDAIDNGAGSCAVPGGSGATVPPNGTLQLDYTCTYSTVPSPPTGTNTASAAWNSGTFFTTNASASGTATVDFSTVTPSTTDEIVTVTDSVQGVLGTVDARTDANPTLFTYTVHRTGVPSTCTTYDNTATFTTNDSHATGNASKSVAVCVGSDLTVTKTATATNNRDDKWLITKDVDKTSVNIAAGGSATFNYSVTVTPNGFTDSGYALSGSIHVANPNDWESIVANVTDSANIGGGVSCSVPGGTGVTIPASGAVNLPYTCSFTGAPTDGTNTATATWNAATFHTPTGTASGTAAVHFGVAQESHKVITVVDDKTDPSNPVKLGTRDFADGPHTFTYSLVKQGVAGTCTSYTNTAVISETGQSASKTVTVCVGSDLTVSKTALATDHRTFLWKIAKNVDQTRVTIDQNGTAHFTYTVTATPNGSTDDGWSVTGQITVNNPNDWESITANVADSLDTGGGGVCSIAGGNQVTVAPSSSAALSYTCTFDSQPSDGTNSATATWDSAAAHTPTGTATGTAGVVFVPSSQTNHTITVVDDKTDPANPVTLGQATWGETPTVFTYTLDKQGVAGTCTDYTNTASISETQQSAAQTVTVCVGSGLLVQASGAASFNRAFNWAINKDVDLTRITNGNGNTGTFTYTVTVTPVDVTDSGYGMGGSVTVTNPNDWEDITTTVTVASDVGGGVDCTVTDGVDKTVPQGGVLTLPYTCAFTGTPAATGTNTATASWSGSDASTATSSADVAVPINFAVAGETHRVITVVDDKTDPAHPVTLGTWKFDDGVHDFTYSLTKAGVNDTCTDYTNIAKIVETGQSDTQVVTLCHPPLGSGTPVVTPPPGLPFTGDFTGLLSRTAIAMLLAGLVLLAFSRRRRQA